MDPAFFTVRTPCARTHQQQLACMHERTGMHEPACMLAAAAAVGCWLLLAAAAAHLAAAAIREVRNENHEIPEKGSEKGSNSDKSRICRNLTHSREFRDSRCVPLHQHGSSCQQQHQQLQLDL